MQRPLLVLAAGAGLSALVSFLVVTATRRPDAPPAPVGAAPGPQPVDVATVERLRALERRLDELAMELTLRSPEPASERHDSASPAAPDAATEADLRARMAAMESRLGAGDVFKTQVAAALEAIEEEKEAERLEGELARRRDEAAKANVEYATFDAELENRLASLRDELYLDGRQTTTLRSLLTIQNERNREMTRLWTEGNVTKEEIGRVFAENRAAHRREVTALLGPEQLRAYREQVARGKLGGRFAFFVGPKDEWEKVENE